MKHFTQGWTQLGHFLPNQITFVDFQKRAGEASPWPILVVRLC